MVAEDHLLVREGLRLLLDTEETRVVATAHDLDSSKVAVAQHHPAVVLTDSRMPPSDTDEGLQAARWLRDYHPDVGLLLLVSTSTSAAHWNCSSMAGEDAGTC